MTPRVNATTHAWRLIKNLGSDRAFFVAAEHARAKIGNDLSVHNPTWPFWNTVKNICIKELKRTKQWPPKKPLQNFSTGVAS